MSREQARGVLSLTNGWFAGAVRCRPQCKKPEASILARASRRCAARAGTPAGLTEPATVLAIAACTPFVTQGERLLLILCNVSMHRAATTIQALLTAIHETGIERWSWQG